MEKIDTRRKNRWSKIKSEKINLSFVGPLQTNKSEDVINHFDDIQSLDRLKLVKSLSKAESKLKKRIKLHGSSKYWK